MSWVGQSPTYSVIGKPTAYGNFRFFKHDVYGLFETRITAIPVGDAAGLYDKAVARNYQDVMIIPYLYSDKVGVWATDQLRRISVPREYFKNVTDKSICVAAKCKPGGIGGYYYYKLYNNESERRVDYLPIRTPELLSPTEADDVVNFLLRGGNHEVITYLYGPDCPGDCTKLTDEFVTANCLADPTKPHLKGGKPEKKDETKRSVKEANDKDIERASKVVKDLQEATEKAALWKQRVEEEEDRAKRRADFVCDIASKCTDVMYETQKLQEARRILDEKINLANRAIEEECKGACFTIGQPVVVLKTGVRGIVAKIERGSIEPIYYVVVGNYGAGSDAYHESELVDDQDLELVSLEAEDKRRPWWKKLLLLK